MRVCFAILRSFLALMSRGVRKRAVPALQTSRRGDRLVLFSTDEFRKAVAGLRSGNGK